MEMIRSHFYVPSMEKVKGTPCLKEERVSLRKQPSLLLHEAHSKMENYRSSLYNQLGARIKNRLGTYLEHDAEMTDNMWQL